MEALGTADQHCVSHLCSRARATPRHGLDSADLIEQWAIAEIALVETPHAVAKPSSVGAQDTKPALEAERLAHSIVTRLN